MASALRFDPLGPRTVHLCIDMQTLFAERTDWHVPWLERVLPAVVRLTRRGGSALSLPALYPPTGRRRRRARGGAITSTGAT